MISPFAGALRRGSRSRSAPARRLTVLLGVGTSAALACTLAVSPAQAAAGNQSPPTGTASASLVTDPASLVNPFVGTTNQGNDFP
ncbi:MAG TPA: hypothetical protein VGX23_22490, partial [Actinocrinis sp.]|nr:hypothetical protein [Actinocrinis sp.]